MHITREIKEMAINSNAVKTERLEDLESDLFRLNEMKEAWGSQYLMERVIDVIRGEIQEQKRRYGCLQYVRKDCEKVESKLKRIENVIKNNALDLD